MRRLAAGAMPLAVFFPSSAFQWERVGWERLIGDLQFAASGKEINQLAQMTALPTHAA